MFHCLLLVQKPEGTLSHWILRKTTFCNVVINELSKIALNRVASLTGFLYDVPQDRLNASKSNSVKAVLHGATAKWSGRHAHR